MGQESNRRSTYLLDPKLQIRLGTYQLILGTCFALTLVGVLHAQWIRFRSWLMLTELRDLIDTSVMAYVQSTLLWVGVSTLIFITASVVITIVTTHRMVGPTVAFRRHIRALIEGNYSARTTLRAHDEFREVAEDLNDLSAALQARTEGAGGAGPTPEQAPAEGGDDGEAS